MNIYEFHHVPCIMLSTGDTGMNKTFVITNAWTLSLVEKKWDTVKQGIIINSENNT